jgi:hypothetical protein
MDAIATIYRPIKPYQTRLLRLHGDLGVPESPLICDLYPATILHPAFEGLAIRLPPDENDCLIEYDALSYTWGDNSNKDTIICNGAELRISQNLSEALRTLRPTKETARWLWADAICINQSDDKEKGEQVWNMLMIYQKAAGVVAWLGPAQEDIASVLVVATSKSPNGSQEDELDFSSIHRGLSNLYTRPWFQRIWVQQEIFAARNLTLICGSFAFQWSQSLSKPSHLLDLPQFQAHKKLLKANKKGAKELMAQGEDDLQEQPDALSTLKKLYQRNLHCFERFSTTKNPRLDIIETLLDTATLRATNPRDHIYGILGMTGFPTKPMPFHQWLTARLHEIFVPIDYSVDMTSLLCAVTWAMLMKGGLAVLAKFKVFALEDDATCEQPLPSWVIDRRLSGRLFRRHSLSVYNNRTIDNPWRKSSVPLAHERFCEDNRRTAIPCTQIVLRGIIDLEFYAKDRSVWKREKKIRDRIAWNLHAEVYQTDLVVNMHSHLGRRDYMDERYDSGVPWLLRPTEQDQFKLVACLSAYPDDSHLQYKSWEWSPGHFEEVSQQHSSNSHRRLAVNPANPMFYDMSPEDEELPGTRTFVIV